LSPRFRQLGLALCVAAASGCGPATPAPAPAGLRSEIAEPAAPEIAQPEPVTRRPRRARPAPPPEPPPQPLPDSVIDRVFFAKNDAAVARAVDSLDAFARLALDDRDMTLVLIARADSGELRPDALSARRASAVKSYLVRRGVPASRIRTLAIGERQPRLAGATDAADVANRSVELATE
jgi:outer membrane protein OmpA-like peptidoglycan-associated protein